MENKSASALVCPECGGDFSAADLLDGDSIVTCISCGRKFSTSTILRKSSEVEAEEIRSNTYRDIEHERTKAYREAEAERTQAYRDVEDEKRKVERERIRLDYQKMKNQSKSEKSKNTKKAIKVAIPIVSSALALFLIIFSIFGFALRGISFDSSAIRLGVSYEDFEGMQCSDVSDMLKEKGFTNIVIKEDGWNIFKKSGEVKKVTIDGCDEYYGYSKFLPDDQIIIYYYK